MSPAERENSSISVEFESADSDAVELGREVERLWDGGQFDEALAQLGDLEARVGRLAIGNSWRTPAPTLETNFWGRDVRIGNRDSLLELSFVTDPSSGHLFIALRSGGGFPHFSVCMSADTGASWEETFTWNGSPPTSLDAAVLANHFYVVYNSPGENAQQVRLRRFLCNNGRADTFPQSGDCVIPCTLDAGDTMREVSLVSNQNNNELSLVTLVSDGSVLVSYGRPNAGSWMRLPTGISSGACCGLDATDDGRSDTTLIFFSYYDATDTLRVYGRSGQPFSLPAGIGTTTSISAYLDTVICAYEDEIPSPPRVRYVASYNGGDTWTPGTLSDTGVAAEAPAVTVLGGGAAVFRHGSPKSELRLCQRTDSGAWSEPVSIAGNEPYWSRPGIEYLGAGVFGVAYLSDASPVVRGAFFDRSDWVYGLAEQRRLAADDRSLRVTPNPLDGRGWLSYTLARPADLQVRVYDPAGRLLRTLFDGHRPAGRQPLSFDVSGMSPGVYFIRVDAAGRALTVPMTVVR